MPHPPRQRALVRLSLPLLLLVPAGLPAQKASGAMPVPAVASLAIKSDRTGAIFKPLASIRVMINLTENGEKARRSGASG